MELKPGYKLTEVGIIPEEWEVEPLGRIASLKNGYAFKSETYNAGGDYKVITIANVQDGYMNAADCSQIVSVPPDVQTHQRLKPGDILVSMTGNVGRVCRVTETHCLLNQRVGKLVATDVEDNFLFLLLRQRPFLSSMGKKAKGGAQGNLSVSDITEFPFAIPSSAVEQRAIAEVLSDSDALLDGLDRLIAQKRDIKLAAMQQLLTGRARLPGFCGEWETTTLFELADKEKELFDDGDWIESEHITTKGIRLIQTGNIGIGRFVERSPKKYIFEESFRSLRCKELRQGDLLVCRLADPAGRACVLPDTGEDKLVTSVDVTIVRPRPERADRVFLANLLSTPEWFRAVSDRSGGTTHKRISRGALGRISIRIPAVQEQTAIAAVLSDMDAELAALEARRDKTRALKQAMMQELLTGRTRLV
jgi:type I restriction enzyme S subunit